MLVLSLKDVLVLSLKCVEDVLVLSLREFAVACVGLGGKPSRAGVAEGMGYGSVASERSRW